MEAVERLSNPSWQTSDDIRGKLRRRLPWTATVIDVLGRPVVAGTAVRFETDRGVFQTGSSTILVSSDANGRAYATLRTLETQGRCIRHG